MYKNVQVLPKTRILCFAKKISLLDHVPWVFTSVLPKYISLLLTHYTTVQTPALEDIKSMVFKEMQNFFARDLSTAQSGAPFIGFEMNDWLKKELNEDIAPEGLLDYTEEEIPDIMTCAGVLVNLICFNINVSWHTTST